MSPVAYTVSFADLKVGSAGVSGLVLSLLLLFAFPLLLLVDLLAVIVIFLLTGVAVPVVDDPSVTLPDSSTVYVPSELGVKLRVFVVVLLFPSAVTSE